MAVWLIEKKKKKSSTNVALAEFDLKTNDHILSINTIECYLVFGVLILFRILSVFTGHMIDHYSGSYSLTYRILFNKENGIQCLTSTVQQDANEVLFGSKSNNNND